MAARKPSPEDVLELVEEGLAEAEKEILSGESDLVVLDEIIAISCKMLDPKDHHDAEEEARNGPCYPHGRNACPTSSRWPTL